MSELQLDRAGRRRSPATMPGFHAGRPPRNKGLRYPADPPKVEEIIAVMRAAGDSAHGRRLRGLIVILWRAGLRAPALARATTRTPDRPAVLRHQRPEPWPTLGDCDRTRAAPSHRDHGRCAPPLRATPAPPRPRRGDGARGRAADRHPTPTRPQQPRHHLRLPARNRQRRDHRDRPRATRTDDPRQRIVTTLNNTPQGRPLIAR
jgi:hypothetical protein